jgi:hypothetical protein
MQFGSTFSSFGPEEKFLHTLFGREFELYAERSPKWIGFSGLRYTQVKEKRPTRE